MIEYYEKLPMGVIIFTGDLLQVVYMNKNAKNMFKHSKEMMNKQLGQTRLLDYIKNDIYACYNKKESFYKRHVQIFDNEFCDVNIQREENSVILFLNKVGSKEIANSILNYHDVKDIKTSEIIEQFTKNAIDGLNMPVAIMDYCDFKQLVIEKDIGKGIDLLNKSDIVYHPEIWIKLFSKIDGEIEKLKSQFEINNIIKILKSNDEIVSSPCEYIDLNGNINYYRVRIVPYIMDNRLKMFLHGANVTNEVRENMELEKLNKLKDEFLTIVSHEIRTPLNIMISAVQLAEGIYEDDITANIRRILHSVRLNCDRIYKLINNIMDLFKSDAGILTLNNTKFDLVLESEKIINLSRYYSEKKNIKIIFDTNEEEYMVVMDKEKYIRTLLNILSNAIKYTYPNKNIYVDLEIKEDKFSISVRDEGVGICEDKIDNIFDRYEQINSSLSRAAEGMGLGLSVAKEFVKCMNGVIKVKSKEGVGSEFIVEFKNAAIFNENNERCSKDRKSVV